MAVPGTALNFNSSTHHYVCNKNRNPIRQGAH